MYVHVKNTIITIPSVFFFCFISFCLILVASAYVYTEELTIYNTSYSLYTYFENIIPFTSFFIYYMLGTICEVYASGCVCVGVYGFMCKHKNSKKH